MKFHKNEDGFVFCLPGTNPTFAFLDRSCLPGPNPLMPAWAEPCNYVMSRLNPKCAYWGFIVLCALGSLSRTALEPAWAAKPAWAAPLQSSNSKCRAPARHFELELCSCSCPCGLQAARGGQLGIQDAPGCFLDALYGTRLGKFLGPDGREVRLACFLRAARSRVF